MAKRIELVPNKTYATKANAIKAVEKKFPSEIYDGLTYLLQRTEDGRFFPVFVGERSVQAMAHFHFNVVM